MLSLFYKILEIKIPKEITLTIFKPNSSSTTDSQIILIKSILGQFKLK